MSPVERVERVLSGRWPDRAPLSFWHHFGPHQVAGEPAVAAHLAHLEAFDLDFLKIMNDNGYPHAGPVERVADLASLTELRGDEGEFGRQLELIAALKRRLRGRVLMTTTVFNAWSTLRHIVRPPREHKPPNLAPEDEVSAQLLSFLRTRRRDAARHSRGRHQSGQFRPSLSGRWCGWHFPVRA